MNNPILATNPQVIRRAMETGGDSVYTRRTSRKPR